METPHTMKSFESIFYSFERIETVFIGDFVNKQGVAR